MYPSYYILGGIPFGIPYGIPVMAHPYERSLIQSMKNPSSVKNDVEFQQTGSKSTAFMPNYFISSRLLPTNVENLLTKSRSKGKYLTNEKRLLCFLFLWHSKLENFSIFHYLI